ncbi:hypothetical protein LINPERHAP1_LOCUS43946, partial [Linum perenne]
GWHENVKLAKAYLSKAFEKIKKWVVKKIRHLEFEEGDLVMVKLYPYRFKHLKNVHKGLLRRYEGHFLVVKKIGRVAYKIEVPSHLEIHPVFHVSQLKPYHNDMEDPRRKNSRRAPTLVTTAHERKVHTILAHRVIPRRGVHPSYKQ